MDNTRSPPLRRLLRESRALLELPRLLVHFPQLARQPRGQGAPVLVLPGFGGSDRSTALLRAYLRYLEYAVHGWGLGVNRGNVNKLVLQITELVTRHAEHVGRSVRLIGWSLGGFIAREAARERPDAVERIITLGTPVVGGPKYTAVAGFYTRMGYDLDAIETEVDARYAVPLTVPVTAIYSRSDAVVAWEACIDRRSPNVEHIEVDGAHLGLGFNPDVYRILARRLADASLDT